MGSPQSRRPAGAWWDAYQRGIGKLTTYQDLAQAVGLLERALNECPDPMWRLWLWYRLSLALTLRGDRVGGAAALARGRDELAKLGSVPLAEAWFYVGEAIAAQLAGQFDLSATLCQFALGVLEASSPELPEEGRARQAQARYELHRRLVQASIKRGDVPGTLAHLDAALAAARRLGNRRYLAVLNVAFIDLLRQMGRLGLAWRMVGLYRELLQPDLNAWLLGDWETALAELYMATGDLAQAAECVERAGQAYARLDVPWVLPAYIMTGAYLAYEQGDLARSATLYEQGLVEAERLQVVDQIAQGHLGLLRGLLLQPRQIDREVLVRASKAAAYADRSGVLSFRATACVAQICLASHLGQHDEVLRLVQHAYCELDPRTYVCVRAWALVAAEPLVRNRPEEPDALRVERWRGNLRRVGVLLLATDLTPLRQQIADRLLRLGEDELAAALRSTQRQPTTDDAALEAIAQRLEDALRTLPLGDAPFYEYNAKDANLHVHPKA